MGGAATAMATIRAAMQPQKAESGARRKNRPAPRSSERAREAAVGSGWAGKVAVIGYGSSVANSGIEQGDRAVDHDVQQHEHHGIEEHQVLHDEDRALAHGGGTPVAPAPGAG